MAASLVLWFPWLICSFLGWLCGVVVSTLDFESGDLGSNPSTTSETKDFLVPCIARAQKFIEASLVLWFPLLICSFLGWLCGVVVSTLDFESGDLGSNPSTTSETKDFLVPCIARAQKFMAASLVLWFPWLICSFLGWLCGVMVSTLDFESGDQGSNPSTTSETKDFRVSSQSKGSKIHWS